MHDVSHRRKFRVFLMKRSLLNCILLMLICHTSLAQDSDVSSFSQSQALLAEKTRIENLIADMESDYGPYDARLLEPLEGLAELYLRSEEFTALELVYSRQLQLMRTDKGLDHLDNIPIVRLILENQIRLGNWSEASDNLEHIRYLQSANAEFSPDALLAAITEQADWLLARVYLDEPRLRARHLFEVRELFDEAEDLVENHYGEDSVELVPVLYRQAVILYQLVAFLNSADGLSGETIDRLILKDGIGRLQIAGANRQGLFTGLLGSGFNIPVVDGDALVGESYLREALSKIDNVRDIFEATSKLEELAMANVAYGDFQILLGRSSGANSFTKAQNLLLESNVPALSIAAFFAQPQVIPMETLPLTLEQALAGRTAQIMLVPAIDADGVSVGEFVSLQESAAIVRMSEAVRRYDFAEPANTVDLQFHISSRGNTSSVKVLNAQPNEGFIRSRAMKAVRRMQFRPVFDGGKTQRVRDVTIRYRFSDR
ncbi:MAG: TonB family protein [Pseudohongiellaceae bacterium]|jgi:TonB family protein